MTCFHKRESLYPPRGFSFPAKGRNFLIHSRDGWCGQLRQVIALQKANGVFVSHEETKAMLMPYWCEMRPELCEPGEPKKNAPKKSSPGAGRAVKAPKKKRGGCGGCGGGRVR